MQNARDDGDRVHGHGVTFAVLKAQFPALHKSEFKQLKNVHGSNDAAIVTALSADHDGWTTVCNRKERRGPVAAAAVRVRRQFSVSPPVTSAVIVCLPAAHVLAAEVVEDRTDELEEVPAAVVALKDVVLATDDQAAVMTHNTCTVQPKSLPPRPYPFVELTNQAIQRVLSANPITTEG